MPNPGLIVGGIGGLFQARSAKKASASAGNAQVAAAQLGIDEQRRQFDAIRKLLTPYVNAGKTGLVGQLALLGMSGRDKQQAAINGIQGGAQYQSMVQNGENAILANASATGGLRGGNTQAAIAQFRPQVLSQLIQSQIGNLGGLASLGQNAAAGVGNAGQASANNITDLLGQVGSAQAGVALARGQANSNLWGGLAQGAGQYFGQGGSLGGLFGGGVGNAGNTSGGFFGNMWS